MEANNCVIGRHGIREDAPAETPAKTTAIVPCTHSGFRRSLAPIPTLLPVGARQANRANYIWIVPSIQV